MSTGRQAKIEVRRPDWAKVGAGVDKIGLARAEAVIRFIEMLKVPSGEGQGDPIRLRDWQKQFVRDVYAPNTDGVRRVRRAILSVGRKNGKTALIAALVLAHLVGPEAVANGEIYSAATDREQAGQVFKFARQIVELDPELDAKSGGLITVVPSTKTLMCKGNGSFYRALSAEAGTKHGLNPSVWIYDELAQARDRELYDVLRTSQGARKEPLGIVISTQSPDPEHPLSKLIDDGLLANSPDIAVHLYAVPDEVEDIYDEEVWYGANPALGDFRSLEDLRSLASSAQRMPAEESAFRNLYLNQRVDQTSPLIPRSEWKACQTGDTLRKGEKIYLALDLSGKVDLTALVGVSADPADDRVGAWHWKPKDYLHDHTRRDNFDYVTAASEVGGSWLETPPGKIIDYEYVARRIAEIKSEYDIVGLAYDRWRMDLLLVEFRRIGLDAYIEGQDEPFDGALRLVKWGQGYNEMSPAVEALETSVITRKFKHNGNPLLGFCFANAIVTFDPAGNRKLDKSATRFRIDGAVATCMSIGMKSRDLAVAEPVKTSFWSVLDPTQQY
ncbi:terminase large subunit [Rhizobium leucaenae]|uniref:terminase large subunit n=1 Tax=Rhizobium leucaenae TaxID=29450 RepID=UPI001FD97919|nr:terminase TerL endonuclease subunit [Rhizobium leucaenae]